MAIDYLANCHRCDVQLNSENHTFGTKEEEDTKIYNYYCNACHFYMELVEDILNMMTAEQLELIKKKLEEVERDEPI